MSANLSNRLGIYILHTVILVRDMIMKRRQTRGNCRFAAFPLAPAPTGSSSQGIEIEQRNALLYLGTEEVLLYAL